MEGTLGAWLATLLCIAGLRWVHETFGISTGDAGMNVMWVLLACLFEAFTDEIDNLLLPLFFLAGAIQNTR